MKKKFFLLLWCTSLLLLQQAVNAEESSTVPSSSSVDAASSAVSSSSVDTTPSTETAPSSTAKETVDPAATTAEVTDETQTAAIDEASFNHNAPVQQYLDTKSLPKKVFVGEIGKIYPLKNSVLSGAQYAFRYQVSNPSLLSISDDGRFVGHQAGLVTVQIRMTAKGEDSRFDAELAARGLTAEMQASAEASPVYETTVEVIDINNFTPVYRLYNSTSKEHLYTTDSNEKAVLSARRDWNYEGMAWGSQKSDTSAPVYRLYHNRLGKHLYTKDTNEYNVLQTRGWKSEGVSFYSNGDVAVYRLYLSSLKKHLYTTDENEKNVLQTRGWRYEGIAWYGTPNQPN